VKALIKSPNRYLDAGYFATSFSRVVAFLIVAGIPRVFSRRGVSGARTQEGIGVFEILLLWFKTGSKKSAAKIPRKVADALALSGGTP
jgi:hypothetical protein